jgi:hypothetical protein
MIAVIVLAIVVWFPIARYFYIKGKRVEQQARLRRLNALRKILNTRE